MNQNTNEIIKKTRSYWYVDGIAEISAGIFILFYALYLVLVGTLSNVAVKSLLLGIGQPVLILAGAWLLRRAVRHYKEKLTYPRTGYVAYPKQKGRRRWKAVSITVIFAVIMGVVMGIISGAVPESLMPVITGGVMMLMFIYLGVYLGVWRFYVLGGVAFALGMVCKLFILDGSFFNLVFFGGQAVAWIISGVVTLRSYLRNTEPVQVDHE